MIKVVIEQEKTVSISGQQFPETATLEGAMNNMKDVGVLVNLLLAHFDNVSVRVNKEDE